MGNSGAEKNLPSEAYHLKPGILIHWETYSLSYYIGKSIADVNTQGADPI